MELFSPTGADKLKDMKTLVLGVANDVIDDVIKSGEYIFSSLPIWFSIINSLIEVVVLNTFTDLSHMVLNAPFLLEARPSVLSAAIFGEPELDQSKSQGLGSEEERVSFIFVSCVTKSSKYTVSTGISWDR